MISVTVYDLLNAKSVLNSLRTKTLPAKGALALARIIREVSKELETYDSVRYEIIDKYAEKDEHGKMLIENGNAKIKENCITDCQNELNESCLEKVELNITPIEEEWLEKINLVVEEAIMLEPFLKK